MCYATSPVVGDCRLISVPLWSCGLNLPYRAVPSSLGLARLVSLAGVFIGRVRPCAPLRSRVSRGVPRPARTPGVGPPPLPPSSPRSLRSRPAGSGYALGECGSLRRGLPPKSRLGSSPFGRSVATLPFWRQPPPPSVFSSRSARPCVSPRLTSCAFVASAPHPRGCPSLRSHFSRAAPRVFC